MKPKDYSCERSGEKITLSLTEEELDIIKNWGFVVSTLKPLSEKDRELYFKITDS